MFKEIIGNQRLRQKINTLELDKEILEDEYDRLITKYNKLIKEMKQRDNRILELEEELKSKKKGINMNDKELFKEISEITRTNYTEDMNRDDLIMALTDMVYEYKKKEEELEAVIDDRNDNWERRSNYSLYGV